MKSRVFIDGLLENKLQKNGFVKIPFWSEDIVEKVRNTFELEFYKKHSSSKKFHTTYETVNLTLIDRVKAYLEPLFIENAKKLFADMRPISASFLVKEPGVNSESPLHQDASFVDEPEHCSVSVWVALQDCNAQNSCLQFIPGSHKLFTGIRFIPYTNQTIDEHKHRLMPYLTQHTIKAGEAFVFYNATLHASGNNLSDAPRLAAVMGFYNASTLLSLYKKNEFNNQIDRFSISVEQLKQINDVFLPSEEQRIESLALPLNITSKAVSRFIKEEFSLPKRILAWANKYINPN